VTKLPVRLLAAVTTVAGLLAGGFEAHLAPQPGGLWHGITGQPSPTLVAAALLAGGFVYLLGGKHPVGSFLVMSAGLLPLVPALTGFGSGLLLFSSSTMILLFGTALGLAAPSFVPRLKDPSPTLAAVIAFVFFLLVGRSLPGPAGPQGDEPHYLLIAESLLRDADVDLKNQFDERAYLRFTGPGLEPHTAPRSPRDRLYAIHTPGLAALIAPGYAVDGYRGARIVVSAAMALGVGLLFAAGRVVFGTTPAVFVFLAATFSTPLGVYANAVFPDSVATLPVALVLSSLVLPPTRWLLVSSCLSLAFLPWLHPRFLPLALLLALAISLRPSFSRARAAAALGPLVISVALLLWHFHALFGTASLSAAYGPGFSSDVSISRIPWGASALLLDRQFGVLLFCPLFLLTFRGMAVLSRKQPFLALLAASIFLTQLAVGGAFTMWWGGASPPTRFLLAAAPGLLLAAGACFADDATSAGARRGLGAAAGFGSGLLFLACLAPRALHNRLDGGSALLRLLAPSLDLDRFFPGFVAEAGIALALAWGLTFLAANVRPSLSLPAALLPLAAGFLLNAAPLLDPFSASLRLLESWSDHRRSLGGADRPSAFVLGVPLGPGTWELSPDVREYSPRFSLPRGVWKLEVESRSEARPDALNLARVSLMGGPDGSTSLVSTLVEGGQPRNEVTFALDSSQQRVNVLGEGIQSNARILQVRLIPVSLE